MRTAFEEPGVFRVFLHGHYNSGNVGDEALLTSVVQALAERLPGRPVEVSFVSAQSIDLPVLPDFRYRTLPDRLFSELCAARSTDLLVFGGGSQFQDLGQMLRVRFLIKPLLLSLVARRVIGLGLSLGPILTVPGRVLSRWTLRQMEAVHVRDGASVELAAALGVQAVPGDDLALCLASGQERQADATSRATHLLVSMVPLATVQPDGGAPGAVTAHATLSALQVALGRIQQGRPELDLRGMDFEPGRDTAPLDTLLGGLRHQPVLSGSVREMFAGLAEGDLVLATRLHSMVFAVLSGLPVLTIDYHPKVRALATRLGLPQDALLPLELLASPEETYRRLEAFLTHPDRYRPALPVPELQARARASVRGVLDRVLPVGPARPADVVPAVTSSADQLAAAGGSSRES